MTTPSHPAGPSGAKKTQADRVADHGIYYRGTRPTKPQLVYVAETSLRRGLTPEIEVLIEKMCTQRWLSQYGDWPGR